MPIGDIPNIGCPVSSLPHHFFRKAQMNSKLNPRKDTIFWQKFSSSFSWFVLLFHYYVLSALKQTTPLVQMHEKLLYQKMVYRVIHFYRIFFCLTPPPYTQFRDPGVCPALWGASRLRGKEVVFFEAKWPGLEPLTSSIRRGRSIHSATPHLASYYEARRRS